MANQATIRLLDGQRNFHLAKAAELGERHRRDAVDANDFARQAREHLAVAGDLAEVLRALDPQHTDDYPAPAPLAVTLVDEIGAFAAAIAAADVPALNFSRRPRIELRLNMPEISALAFMNRLQHTGAWQVEQHESGGQRWLSAEQWDSWLRLRVDAWFTVAPQDAIEASPDPAEAGPVDEIAGVTG